MAFGVLPIIVAAFVSLTDLDIAGLGDLSSVSSSSASRTTRRCSPTRTSGSRWATPAFFVLIGVPAIVVISLLVALCLNASQSRLFRALRSFYFLPAITAIVAISLIWGYLYNTQFGLLNYLLCLWASRRSVAERPVHGPGSRSRIVAVWRGTGLNIIIFLAALQGVPRSTAKRPRLDGACEWQEDPSRSWSRCCGSRSSS